MIDAQALQAWKNDGLGLGVIRWLEQDLGQSLDDVLSFEIHAAFKLGSVTAVGKSYVPTDEYMASVNFLDGSAKQRIFTSQELR